MLSVIRPKKPNNPSWVSLGALDLKTGYAAYGYQHPRLALQVISALEVPEGEAEYHVSVVRMGKHGPKRCSKEEAILVLKQFGMDGALEDNHSPTARSFWLPVAEKEIGHECECKADETAIIEGDFEWRPLFSSVADAAKTK